MERFAKRVLVVDDSAVMREAIGRALEAAGYAVVQAVDGADGLERYRSDESIGLVISDVNMPRMSGLDMLDAIKRCGDERAAGIPVVLLTTDGAHSQVDRARAAGARAWMVKPFQSRSLVAVVERLLAG